MQMLWERTEYSEFACRWQCASHTRLQSLQNGFRTSPTPGTVKVLQDGRAGTRVTSASKNQLLSLPVPLLKHTATVTAAASSAVHLLQTFLSAGDATTHLTANVMCKTLANLLVHSTRPLRSARGKHPLFRRGTLSHTDVKLQVT